MVELLSVTQVVRTGLRSVADLVLPVECVGCDVGGAILCPRCRGELAFTPGQRRWLADGLTVHSAARYDGIVREVILGAKRTGARPLVGVLAQFAALSLMQAIDTGVRVAAAGGGDRSVGSVRATSLAGTVVVPVHSGRQTVARVGADLAMVVARRAVAIVRANGYRVRVADVLSVTVHTQSQKSLGRTARSDNARGSMACARSPRLARALARQLGSDPVGGVLLFDDVVTTGSTLIEAHRALVQAHIPVARAATIATSDRPLHVTQS